MCSKGGGSPPVPSSASTAFQSTVSPSATAGPLYTDFLNRANALSGTPFNPAMQGSVAPMNAQQIGAGNQIYTLGTTGMDAARAKLGTAADYMTDVGRHMGDWDPSRVKEIMSPFTEEVVGATQNWFNNQNAIQGNDLLSQAIRSGNAFGGDRAGVAEGILAGQQQLSQAPVIAGLRQAGYTQALDEYNRLKQFGLLGAQAGLGASQAEIEGVKSGLAGAGAAMGWGGLQQAQQQRELDVAQQNAMMSSAYPFQTLNWYGSILGGIGPLTGSFAQGFNTPPEQSGLSSALGLGASAIGLGTSLFGGGSSGGGAAGGGAAGAAAPAAAPVDQTSTAEGVIPGARGGIIRPRSRGGPVPFAYGGGTTRDANETGYRRDEDEQEGERRSEDHITADETPYDVDVAPQGARKVEVPNIFGRGLQPARAALQPTFPAGGSTQPQQKSTAQSLLDFGAKVAPMVMPLMAMSDPKTKTDIQRVGRTDDGQPLHAFRYKGDPKTYPKVVGPMAIPRRFQDGGDIDTEIMTDETPDPVVAGQQFARDYAGRTTWFNPRNERGGYTYTDDRGQNWTDTGAMRLREGPHASGLPSTTRGFATPGSGDLGNWFEVSAPGGRRTYAQKTDVGPPGVVDLNAPLAASLYGSPNAIPAGRTSVRDLGRNKPAEAEPPVTDMPFVDPEAAPTDGRAGPTRTGAGPDGGRSWTIPGLAKSETFAQRLAGNPLWQFGTALMAKPGIKGRELSAVGGAAQLMSAQQLQERNRVLDEKQQMIDVNGKIGFVDRASGRIIQTDLDHPTERAATRAEQRETEREGRRAQSAKELFDYKRQAESGDPFEIETKYGGKTTVRRLPDGSLEEVKIIKPGQPQPAPGQGTPATQQPAPAPGQQGTGVGNAPVPQQQQPQPAPTTTQPSPTLRQTEAPATPAPPQQGAITSAGPTTEDAKQVDAQIRAGSVPRFKAPPQVDPELLEHFGTRPEEFDYQALQYAYGNQEILKGFGNNRAGIAMKRALIARSAQHFIEQGYTPEQANAAVAEFQAQKAGARSLGVQVARIDAAIGAARGVAPRVIEASARVPRTQYPDLNSVYLAYQHKTGDTNVATLATSVHALVNNYASAMGKGNSVLTDNAQKRVMHLLNTNFTHEQMTAVVNQMMLEMESEQAGMKKSMGSYLGTGQQQPQQTQPQQTPPASSRQTAPTSKPDVMQNGVRFRWNGTKYEAVQ